MYLEQLIVDIKNFNNQAPTALASSTLASIVSINDLPLPPPSTKVCNGYGGTYGPTHRTTGNRKCSYVLCASVGEMYPVLFLVCIGRCNWNYQADQCLSLFLISAASLHRPQVNRCAAKHLTKKTRLCRPAHRTSLQTWIWIGMAPTYLICLIGRGQILVVFSTTNPRHHLRTWFQPKTTDNPIERHSHLLLIPKLNQLKLIVGSMQF